MEHLSPLWTLLTAIVTGILTPIIIAAWNQRGATRRQQEQDEADARDSETLCQLWESHGDRVEVAFRFCFQAWREGKDLNYPMAALDQAVNSRPKKRL